MVLKHAREYGRFQIARKKVQVFFFPKIYLKKEQIMQYQILDFFYKKVNCDSPCIPILEVANHFSISKTKARYYLERMVKDGLLIKMNRLTIPSGRTFSYYGLKENAKHEKRVKLQKQIEVLQKQLEELSN